MDQLAKSFWHTVTTSSRPNHHLQPFPGQWSIWHNNARLVNWTRHRAEDHYYGAAARTYWEEKLDIPPSAFDWQALGNAFQRFTLQCQLWIPRYLNNFLPIGRNLLRWKLTTDDLCPRCPHPESSRHHILRCPHPEARDLIKTSLSSLDQWLLTSETHPALRKACVSMLRAWYASSTWRLPLNTSLPVRRALRSQFDLGPEALADGIIHRSWTETQQLYYEFLGRRRTGFRWHSQLIRRIWTIAWDLWRHRLKILDSPDSLALARQHDSLNSRIDLAFRDRPLLLQPSAQRWFARTPSALYLESLDFKHLWLEMVASILAPPPP
jgi:hypothetical protein